jgi:hypothetical protein
MEYMKYIVLCNVLYNVLYKYGEGLCSEGLSAAAAGDDDALHGDGTR